jgi:hypothetical protein
MHFAATFIAFLLLIGTAKAVPYAPVSAVPDATVSVAAQPEPPAVDPLHKPFDELLDLYVRDGLVYYRALKGDRGRLDRYLRALDGVSASDYSAWPRERQIAFWINAYNAFVLRTVIDNYPISRAAPQYPKGSIRQIAGAFDRQTFRAAGRSATLDGIEKDVLTPFGDPRIFLALGRGALGGGRLRSEAFNGARLEQQLTDVAAEAVDRKELARVDSVAEVLSISPMFSWREAAFTTAYADKAPAPFASRSPLERSVLALLAPHLLTSEREYLEKNSFKVQFHDFDWRLNDLTGGRRN